MISKKQMIKTFIDLVKIDSPSGQEEKVANYILNYLKKIKVKVISDKYGNIIAKIPGAGLPLMLSSHMDTVEPGRNIKPIIKKGIIATNGSTILGADDKAGIACILEAVKYLKKKKINNRSLELVFTREEEVGLKGAFNLNYKNIKAKEGLVIDSCGPLGHITISAPFIYVIHIKIKGKSAHAGFCPEKGINAIQIASKAISELKIGRINKSTTNNIGVINGGVVGNSVPDQVIIKAEARSSNLKDAQTQVDLINKAFKKYTRIYKASLFFKAKLGCNGFCYSKNDSFIKKISQLNQKMGIKTVYKKSGGGSDANAFASKKMKIIDISYGGKNAHTTREIIKINELVALNKFLIEFIKV